MSLNFLSQISWQFQSYTYFSNKKVRQNYYLSLTLYLFKRR